MPQLDNVSWLDQVFTTILVIFVFYLFLSLMFLPALTSITKGRYKLQAFRKYAVQFIQQQNNLFVQDTKNNLSFALLNNLFLMDTYYQPVFNAQLQKNLNNVCYIQGDVDSQAVQMVFANKVQINYLHLQQE